MEESNQISTRSRSLQIGELAKTPRNGHEAANYLYENRDADQSLHLLDYWHIIRKRLWLIIGIAVLIPTLVAIVLIRKPDIYEAQARIQVDLENANPLLNGMSKSPVIFNSETNDPAYFNTQLQILTGPGLLRRVVKNLDLEHNPEFRGDAGGSGKSWTDIRGLLGLKPKTNVANPALPPQTTLPAGLSSAAAQEQVEAERLSDYVEALQAGVKVEPVKETRLTVRETRLIDVSYRHTDPRLAAKIVNSVAETFVNQNYEKKTEIGRASCRERV